MSIIGTFPTTLQNGTTEDATQVMALFSFIQSQANGNACPATTTSAILKGNGSGGTSPAVAGTDYQSPLPAGLGGDYFGGVVPNGWLLCDGSAISRTTYAALFTAIGTTWGAGDGSTTFNVPDSRRRVSIGSGGVSVSGPANTVGSVGGEETHTLLLAELATHGHPDSGHSHSIVDPGHTHTGTVGSGASGSFALTGATVAPIGNVGIGSSGTGIAGTATGNANIPTAGSSTAHNNMQPSIVVTKIIKT